MLLIIRKRSPNATENEFSFPQIVPTRIDDSSLSIQTQIPSSVQPSVQQNVDSVEAKTVRIESMIMHYDGYAGFPIHIESFPDNCSLIYILCICITLNIAYLGSLVCRYS